MNLESKKEFSKQLVRDIIDDLNQKNIDNVTVTPETISFLDYLKNKLVPGERIPISLFDSEKEEYAIVRTETDLVIIKSN